MLASDEQFAYRPCAGGRTCTMHRLKQAPAHRVRLLWVTSVDSNIAKLILAGTSATGTHFTQATVLRPFTTCHLHRAVGLFSGLRSVTRENGSLRGNGGSRVVLFGERTRSSAIQKLSASARSRNLAGISSASERTSPNGSLAGWGGQFKPENSRDYCRPTHGFSARPKMIRAR
jgi:hypothetical protein